MNDLASSREQIILDTDDCNIHLNVMTPKKSPVYSVINEKMSGDKECTKAPVDCKTLAKQFCEYTTAHGWGRVTKTSLRFVQALWIAITVCALACNAGHITLLVRHFMTFQSEIRWRVTVSEIQFPSVTICNTQAMSKSALWDKRKDSSSRLHQWEQVLDGLDRFDEVAAQYNLSEQFNEIKYKLREPSGYFQNIGEEYHTVGHQITDLVLSCIFMFQPCKQEDFSVFVNQDYFNCYTFNGGNVSRETYVAKTTGPSAGLSMILYLETTDTGSGIYNDSYHKYLNTGDTAGVRIIVHSPNSRPYPLEQGFDIPPGFSANVNLQVRGHVMLDSPYGECMRDQEISSKDIYKYTMSDCILVCKQLYVIRMCGCISAMLPLPDGTESFIPYCEQWRVNSTAELLRFFKRVNCERDTITSFTTEKVFKECKCPGSCNKYEYSHQVTMSFWPIQSSQAEFYRIFVLDHPEQESLKAYKNLENYTTLEIIKGNLIGKNFARINVYIQDPIIEMFIQKPSYEWPNLASDIGGTFGLWIGMSLITWCEVVELFVIIMYNKIQKCSQQWLQKKRENNHATEET